MGDLSDSICSNTTNDSESVTENIEEELPRGEASKVNNDLNSMFVQRLEYLERAAPNDLKLKVIVYQEWIDALLQSTQSAIKHKEAIETEILEKVEPNHSFMPTNIEQINADIVKCRGDIESLIRYLQHCLQEKNWECKGFPPQ